MLIPLTLLHSNDIHGDFLAEEQDGTLVGGLSRLSGYITKVRNREPNVLYAISGDMFRGSVIDSDYKGVSTMELLNLLAPDVMSLGNHEADYGLGHLLFLEKCAKFPMICANLYVKLNGARLFRTHVVLEVGGLKVLFIGLLTREVLDMAKRDPYIGPLVDVSDAAREVGRICNNYRGQDIGLTVLLTHIGFEEDKRLAAQLDPDWGVDLILGGHSHTLPREPALVNDVLIAQAGFGTDQIGRFDLVVDRETGRIHSYTWQAVPITDQYPRDLELVDLVTRFKTRADSKYNRILTRFTRPLTHPGRKEETELSDLFADLLAQALDLDVMLLGTGSVRCRSLGPAVTYGSLQEAFPFDDSCTMLRLTGGQLKAMLAYMLREESFSGAHTEFYVPSHRLRFAWSRSLGRFTRWELDGAPLADGREVSVGIQQYHLSVFRTSFGVPVADLIGSRKPRVLSTSCFDILEEQLSLGLHLNAETDGRITIEP